MASMKTARYFTKLDLCKLYWQVPMNENDIRKMLLLLKIVITNLLECRLD